MLHVSSCYPGTQCKTCQAIKAISGPEILLPDLRELACAFMEHVKFSVEHLHCLSLRSETSQELHPGLSRQAKVNRPGKLVMVHGRHVFQHVAMLINQSCH